jgi:hypothetical protein
MNRYELRNSDNGVLALVEAESIKDADAYGLARLPGYTRAVALPEDDEGGLIKSWRRRHPEWSEAQVLTAARGITPRPAEVAAREAAQVAIQVVPGDAAAAWRRTHPEFTEDMIREAVR